MQGKALSFRKDLIRFDDLFSLHGENRTGLPKMEMKYKKLGVFLTDMTIKIERVRILFIGKKNCE